MTAKMPHLMHALVVGITLLLALQTAAEDEVESAHVLSDYTPVDLKVALHSVVSRGTDEHALPRVVNCPPSSGSTINRRRQCPGAI